MSVFKYSRSAQYHHKLKNGVPLPMSKLFQLEIID